MSAINTNLNRIGIWAYLQVVQATQDKQKSASQPAEQEAVIFSGGKFTKTVQAEKRGWANKPAITEEGTIKLTTFGASEWAQVGIKFEKPQDFSKYGQLKIKLRGAKETKRIGISLLDKGRFWGYPPVREVRDILEGEITEVTIDLTLAAKDTDINLKETGEIAIHFGDKTNWSPGEEENVELANPKDAIIYIEEIKLTLKKAEVKKELKTVAYGIDGERGSEEGDYEIAYFCYNQGPFDFSQGTHLKITFPKKFAGIEIRVELLFEDPDKPGSLSRQTYTIGKDGIVVIPLSEFSQWEDKEGVGVYSGRYGPKGEEFRQPKPAKFEKVEIITKPREDRRNKWINGGLNRD